MRTYPITLTVNREKTTLEVPANRTLLELLKADLHLASVQARLRDRRVRRLHRDPRRAAGQLVPGAGRRGGRCDDLDTVEGEADVRRRCRTCRRPSPDTTRSSAASAPPA